MPGGSTPALFVSWRRTSFRRERHGVGQPLAAARNGPRLRNNSSVMDCRTRRPSRALKLSDHHSAPQSRRAATAVSYWALINGKKDWCRRSSFSRRTLVDGLWTRAPRAASASRKHQRPLSLPLLCGVIPHFGRDYLHDGDQLSRSDSVVYEVSPDRIGSGGCRSPNRISFRRSDRSSTQCSGPSSRPCRRASASAPMRVSKPETIASSYRHEAAGS